MPSALVTPTTRKGKTVCNTIWTLLGSNSLKQPSQNLLKKPFRQLRDKSIKAQKRDCIIDLIDETINRHNIREKI